jgi:putative endopeptidase
MSTSLLVAFIRPLVCSLCLCLFGGVAAAASEPSAAPGPADLDPSTSPRQDFYQYANGGWLQRTTIPDAYARWGTFEELGERVQEQLLQLSMAAAQADAPVGSLQQKIGTFYASGMDTAAIEKAGATPLEPALVQIGQIHDAASFAQAVAELHKIGASPLFALAAAPDARDSAAVVGQLYQAGMGLPEPEDYQAPAKADRRKAYCQHIARMFVHLGLQPGEADCRAAKVLEIETDLASAALHPVQRRDPIATYNRRVTADLSKEAPGFAWTFYFEQLGLGAEAVVVVEHPAYLQHAAQRVPHIGWADWQAYLTWRVLHRTAAYLSDKFVQEHFDFYGRTLQGAQALQPRNQRVVETLDAYLGEAFGALYVEQYFNEDARQRALSLVQQIRSTLRQTLAELAWMSQPTRKLAMAKLDALRVKVGYPQKFDDMASLALGHGYASNVWHAYAYAFAQELQRIGQPTDKDRWEMTPQTVNAYYSPSLNEIVFPAAILQPPFFSAQASDAQNYGAIGGVIGHELTHGFDDQGRLYDGQGNLADWWTPADAAAFSTRAHGIIAQFANYRLFDEPLNGELTQGENIADLGGAKLAFAALRSQTTDAKLFCADAQTLSPAQQFFISWAQVWRNQVRKPAAMRRLQSDPHAPGLFRTNGPLSNMEEFYAAFGVQPGDAMYRDQAQRLDIW